MASVAVRGISKKFGALSVLSNIDLNVDDGEFVVLVGPSGCGKSTLLRMIAGLEAASGGKIFIGQKDVENEPPKERDIAMVFQSYALYPNMNVFRNLAFGLRMRGEAASEIDRKVRGTAEMLGLTPLLNRLPRELSGGQRQRVAMGRAIVRNPKVFLFDEPLSNLDAKLRVAMRSEIKARHLKLKTTTIYVTHDQVEAMTMADRIVVMREGRIEQIGAPFDIYHRPRNTFVAEFIGSPPMNFFRAEIEANGGPESSLRLGAGQIPISGCAPPGEVTVGIRPEHLSLGGDLSATTLHGTVLVVEPTGSSTHVVVDVGDSLVTVHSSGGENPKPGAAVTVTPASNRLHLFHARTGERLDTKIH